MVTLNTIKTYIENYWKTLLQLDRDFCGKICPIQLYWHSFDLAVTRFSGREAPDMPEAGSVDQEAYSHEVISFGFWAGDENIPNAALYSYTFPAPDGLDEFPLEPEQAFWTEQRGSPMALLMYEDARKSENSEQAILSFLESAYHAGVEKANWNTEPLHK